MDTKRKAAETPLTNPQGFTTEELALTRQAASVILKVTIDLISALIDQAVRGDITQAECEQVGGGALVVSALIADALFGVPVALTHAAQNIALDRLAERKLAAAEAN